ncbi:PspC domain-containing protein [Actinomycetospora termitidis]|uniref:PspC domain-containing protein n=1 Tax=Actinomycetospora termitidis TaxID=3053470 RepID=A0ABT7M5J4_9PSEU|nr:PspC domain-containing protein [Actinomycetospora sp. Odt1-22]MDL5155519.1 PspC domain-containing protein [Actinomycetospora sp. Odt1-22]
MSGAGVKDGTDVASVARGVWETRPARRQEDTKVAGVAGAIARRYALDPTLVRVAFVVWAIVGGGVLLYLLGWLVLPSDPADPVRRDRAFGAGHRGKAPTLVVIATVIAAIATLAPAFSGRVMTLVALGVAAVAVYLLHTGRSDLGVPGTPGVAPVAFSRPDESSVPVAWDALGADPRSWRLPTAAPPAPAPPVERGPRSVLTPVTLALALLAAGLAGVALLLGVPGVTGVWVPAAALGVVGLGLVVGSLRSRPAGCSRRGLVFVAIPLLIATVIGSVAVSRGPGDDGGFSGEQQGVGDVVATPVAAAQVLPGYRTGLGDVDLDLSRLAPGGPPIRTSVESGAGDLTVTVPATADVTVTCAHGLGDMDCLGRTGNAVTGLVDLGPDGPGGPVIDLQVRNGVGDVAVRRG